jgi:hypothetical protein
MNLTIRQTGSYVSKIFRPSHFHALRGPTYPPVFVHRGGKDPTQSEFVEDAKKQLERADEPDN